MNTKNPAQNSSSFYITTAIDYPNGSPHIGHAYEKIVADSYARWYQLAGRDVKFLVGTDENGQKLAKSAEEVGEKSTQVFVDRNAASFLKMFQDLHLTNTDFIRTTEKRHVDVVQDFWRDLEKAGYIYFDRYSGMYCLGCEAFYTETQAPEGTCPHHGTKLEPVSEEGYFFKTSAFHDWIVSQVKDHPNFVFPESARSEILGRLNAEPLKDLSISRPNHGWGIPTPSRADHVIYTWFDALISYYAALQAPADLKSLWPAQMHVIGKDITWFHVVVWPIMLKARGLPIPDQVYVHGMLTAADGRKMSKSLGNVVDPYDLINRFPLDSIRYYMLRAIPSGQDGRFSVAELIDRHNNELANDFGNLTLRVIKLAQKRLGAGVTRDGAVDVFDLNHVAENVSKFMDERLHHRALDEIWSLVNRVNSFMNEHEPWRIKDDLARFHDIIYAALVGIYGIAQLLRAFVPDSAEKTLAMLGQAPVSPVQINTAALEFIFGETQSLFPKIEVDAK